MSLVSMAKIVATINSDDEKQAANLLRDGIFEQADYDLMQEFQHHEVETGIVDNALNFHLPLDHYGLMLNDYPCDKYRFDSDRFEKSVAEIKAGTWRSSYVVADNFEQLKEYWKEWLDDSNRIFVIGVELVHRDPESPGGGFRWHKQGTYIGTHEKQCEYFNDEEGIEQVWMAHLYELKSEQYATMAG